MLKFPEINNLFHPKYEWNGARTKKSIISSWVAKLKKKKHT